MWIRAHLLLCAAWALTSCSSIPETHLYTLVPSPSVDATGQLRVGAQSVRLPAYLVRPGIVLSSGAHQLNYARHNIWAEPLREGIARALEVAIGQRLDGMPAVLSLTVDVRRFHGSVDGVVALNADWQAAFDNDRVVSGHFAQSLVQTEEGYADLVATQYKLIQELAFAMAAKISSARQRERS